MPRKVKLSPRKEPVQERSRELRNSLLQAATYVLKKEGPYGFTTNKVADRAGVNIASLYQYYPNKESLLFHLVELEWSATLEAVVPILTDKEKSYRERLHRFVEKFFETEVDEFDLRKALGPAAITIEDTEEFKNLVRKADDIYFAFFSEALKGEPEKQIRRKTDFIRHLITSFAVNLPKKAKEEVRDDAKTLSEMIGNYFGIP
jgi:AcrR family transcriptional regulator